MEQAGAALGLKTDKQVQSYLKMVEAAQQPEEIFSGLETKVTHLEG